MRQDFSFLYQKGDSGYFVTIRGDFAELIKVDVAKKRSQYIKIDAPIDLIRKSVASLVKKGYRQVSSLDLVWRPLACD